MAALVSVLPASTSQSRAAPSALQPFQLRLQCGRTRCDLGKQAERRTQPTQTDPHLVHAFRIAAQLDAGLVALNLCQAVVNDLLQALLCAEICSKQQCCRLGHRRRL